MRKKSRHALPRAESAGSRQGPNICRQWQAQWWRFDRETMTVVVSCFTGGCPPVFTFPACRMWNRKVLFCFVLFLIFFSFHIGEKKAYSHCHAWIWISFDRAHLWTSLVAQMIMNLPEVQETQIWVLSGEDPLEKGMATHSNILAWRIPWTEESGGLQSIGLQRVRHDWVTFTFFHFTHELPPSTPHWRCSWLFPTLHWSCDTKNKVEILCVYMTQFSSVAQSSVASLSITNSRSLLKLMSIESVMPYNHPILCHPLLLLSSIFPSIRGFPMS